MSVFLTDDEIKTFANNGFSEDDLQNTISSYRQEGLDDNAIRSKIDQKLNTWETPKQPQQPQKEVTPTVDNEGNYSFNLGVEENVYNHDKSKWHDNLRQFGRNTARFFLPKGLENKYIGSKEDEEFLNKYNDSNVPTYEQLNADYKAGKIDKNQMLEFGELRKKLDDLRADSEFRDYRNKEYGKEALLLGTAGLGGGAGLGLKGTAGIMAGAGIGGATYGLGNSLIDENLNPVIEIPKEAALWSGTAGVLGAGGKGIQKLAETPAGQAVKQKILNNTVGKMSNSELGTKILFALDDLGQFLTKERALPKIKKDKVLPEQPLSLKDLKNNIRSNQFEKKQLQTIKGAHKNRVWTETLQNEDNAVIKAEREFNDIIKEMSNNTKRLNDEPYLRDLENRIQKIINDSPYPNEPEFVNSFWNKYVKALDDGYKYNELRFGTNKNNYFGGEFEQPASPLPAATKQAKLTQTMKDAGTLPEELKSITPEYEVLHNAEIAAQAKEALNQNADKVLGELQQKAFNKDTELSALDFETARQTLSKLYQEGRVDEALALTDLISQKASKAGQSVQALSLWSKTTPEGAVRYAQKIISDYNKKAKKPLPQLSEQQAKEIMELAKNTQLSEIGTRENDIANQLLLKYFKELVPASAGSKLRTLQNISLLLNPKTFLRNIGGNSIFAAMDTGVSKPIAAGLDKIVSKFTGQRTRVLPQLKEYAQGLGKGFKEGAEDVRLGINTRDKLGSRFNLNDRTSFDNIPGLKQLEKALNYSLQVPDRMFYQAAYNESIANQLKASGLTEPTEEMIKNATNEALEAVYQNNSALGELALNTRALFNNKFNINGYGVGDLLLPYAQTPANVAQQGFNYSPLGFTNAIKNAMQGNQRQATLDAARALTGTGIMGLGAYGSASGLINPESDNYEIQKNYEALGIKPNTLNIGDYNVSFNQLQPLAAPVLGGAATYQSYLGEGGLKDIVDKSTNSVLDLGMLQNTLNFVNDLSSKGLGTAAINVVSGVPSRFIPTGIKQITDLTDNIQRDTSSQNPIIQGVNQAITKIPGANKTLPIKYDVTGQPVKKYETEGLQRIFDATINPVFVNKRKDDPTVNKLIDLYETTGDKSVLLPLADKKVQYKDLQGNQVKRPLNARERNVYQRQLGTINKQVLDSILNTEFYNNLDDEYKVDLINKTQRYVKGYVDENLWGKPNAQKRALIKKLTADQTDEITRKILKMYQNQVLPVQVKNIYDQNFK